MKAILVLLLALPFLSLQDRGEVKAEYARQKKELSGVKEAGPWVSLGEWASENRLKSEAKFCFKRAEKFDRENGGAVAGMKGLGYVLEKGIWHSAKQVYRKELRKVASSDLDGRHELAEWAKGYGLLSEWEKQLRSNLKANPYHAPSRLSLGYKRAYGEWWTEKELARERAVDEAFREAIAAGETADVVHEKARAAGWSGTLGEAKEILRRAASPTGTKSDQKLTLQADKYPGEYTFGIPEAYVPWRKNPMIVFLHGGGAGTGDGDDYFPQVWPQTSPRGYITVCPTVLEKVGVAWNNPRHVAYIRAIVAEFLRNYNVDENRLYLMGHSMGGFGCFYVGTNTTDLFAAISPWSGGPSRSALSNLKYTPTYIIHGKDDRTVRVDGSRNAAKQLRQMKYPVVYVEINGYDHAVPGPEKAKAFDWLEQWRLDPRARKRK